MTMDCQRLLNQFQNLIKDPKVFLNPKDDLIPQLKRLEEEATKALSAAAHQASSRSSHSEDSTLLDSSIKVVSKLSTGRGKLSFNVDKFVSTTNASKKSGRQIVDDSFFKLSDMEDWMDRIEGQTGAVVAEDEEDEDIDYFKDVPEDDGKEAMFNQFFDPPNEDDEQEDDDNKEDDESDEEDMHDDEELDLRDADVDDEADVARDLVEASDTGSDDDDEEEGDGKKSNKPKTPFELQTEREKARIKKLEQQSLESKPWQLSGETSATQRPENSLLEEHLQFDFISRNAPLITEESTKNLEEIIKSRIKDESWDDVVRKVKPTEQPFEFRRRLELEHEKSKVSLSKIYEQEYLKKVSGETVEKEDPAHEEIKRLSKALFMKLNALSSFHFTPAPPEPEVKMINNLPAVAVEEAVPITVADSTLLAPQEVLQKNRREEKGVTEKSDTDRKRERRLKKKIQHLKAVHATRKAASSTDPIANNKYVRLQKEKEKAKLLSKTAKGVDDGIEREKAKALRSSKSFFAKLEEEVKADIEGKTKGRKNTATGKQVNVRSLKL